MGRRPLPRRSSSTAVLTSRRTRNRARSSSSRRSPATAGWSTTTPSTPGLAAAAIRAGATAAPDRTRRSGRLAHEHDAPLGEAPSVGVTDQPVVVTACAGDGTVAVQEDVVGARARGPAVGVDVDDGVEADVLAALVRRLTLLDERLDVGPPGVGRAHHAERGVVGVEVGPLVEAAVVTQVAVLRDRAADRVLVAHEQRAYSVLLRHDVPVRELPAPHPHQRVGRARTEAERRIAAPIGSARTEAERRIAAPIGSARTEAERRIAAPIGSARTEAERRIAAPIGSARTEAERRIAAPIGSARTEAERRIA